MANTQPAPKKTYSQSEITSKVLETEAVVTELKKELILFKLLFVVMTLYVVFKR